MKNNHLSLDQLDCLRELNENEILLINGGSSWEDIVHTADVAFRCLLEFGKAAGSYQASLPGSLKK